MEGSGKRFEQSLIEALTSSYCIRDSVVKRQSHPPLASASSAMGTATIVDSSYETPIVDA